MKVLITGASSGIGRDMAHYLSSLGHELVLVARDEKKLTELAIKLKAKAVVMDLSNPDNCLKLHEENRDIDFLINNAGFGVFGEFSETSLEQELNLIDTNIKAVHILTKLYLQDMIKNDQGHILNVASSSAFLPGPLMASYYASKAYVLRLSEGIYEELRKKKSNVVISVLCPGPVDTNFNNVAHVKFKGRSLTSEYVARYGIDKCLKKKLIIIPSIDMKISHFLSKVVPDKTLAKVTYKFQTRKK